MNDFCKSCLLFSSEASMENSEDPDQTAPIGAVYTGSMPFASILNSSVMLGNYLHQTTFSDAFSLGTLRVRISNCRN